MTKKVVLAFSGGLDTSFCIPYLIDQGFEVHTLFVNTGGIPDKEQQAITKRANELGSKKHINLNVEKSLWSEILVPLIQSGALYQNKYPALCSDRYLIVKESIKFMTEVVNEDALKVFDQGLYGYTVIDIGGVRNLLEQYDIEQTPISFETDKIFKIQSLFGPNYDVQKLNDYVIVTSGKDSDAKAILLKS